MASYVVFVGKAPLLHVFHPHLSKCLFAHRPHSYLAENREKNKLHLVKQHSIKVQFMVY